MKKIKLTQGQFALVDDADYEWLNQWKWHAQYCKYTDSYYAVRKSPTVRGKRRLIRMHRQLLRLSRGDKRQADHINHATLDNRRNNLRGCTLQQNSMNRNPRQNTSSKYKGVYWNKEKRKWQVKITAGKKNKYLGCFNSEIDAARAYNEAAKKYFGEFAHLNKIEG